MTIEEIKKKVQENEYDFLRENKNLGNNIMLLGLGGSHSYGTFNANSDLDIRGIATRSYRDILLGRDFEQVVDVATDTTIYSFDKMITLLKNCNPNIIEILGLKPEHYLYTNIMGKALLEHKKLFLSRRAFYTFGGYASSQLRRLENKSARLIEQSRREEHVLNSIENARVSFKDRYFTGIDDGIDLYIDKAVQEGFDTEIFMDVNLKHYPLRDYADAWNEMRSIVKDYSKIGKRNSNAIEHSKLGKHMMHLVRLYLMCFDILEREEIKTYREDEHDFLMSIREGKYLDSSRQPISEFYEILDEYEKRLKYAYDNTSLPDVPDASKIDELVYYVNNSTQRY